MRIKKILILFAILLLLLSCSSKTELLNTETNFIYEEDMNIEIMTDQIYQSLAPSNNGIFYALGNYLYFYDFATHKTVFLCNKPNCRHNLEIDQIIGQECNAYLKNASYGGFLMISPIIYNNEYLYMIQQSIDFQTGFQNGYDIVRVSQDGSNREKIIHCEERISNIFVHRNILYYTTQNNLYNVELSNFPFESKELLTNRLDTINNAFCKDNFLYISASIYKNSNDNNMCYGIIGRLNLATNEFEIIKENQNSLYFNLVDDNIIFTKDFDTYLYFVDSKEERFVSNESGIVHVTNNYIFVVNGPNDYIEGHNSISVFDKNYNLIDTIILIDGMKHCTSGVFNDQVFILFEETHENSNIERIYSLRIDENELSLSIFAEIDKNQSANGYQWNVNDYN